MIRLKPLIWRWPICCFRDKKGVKSWGDCPILQSAKHPGFFCLGGFFLVERSGKNPKIFRNVVSLSNNLVNGNKYWEKRKVGWIHEVSACYKSIGCWLHLEKGLSTSVKVEHLIWNQSLFRLFCWFYRPKSENSSDRKRFFWSDCSLWDNR